LTRRAPRHTVESVRRAAVFDMDGVLVDNSRFHRAAWRQLCQE